MLDFSTYDLGYAPAKFFDMFIKSGVAGLFEIGDPRCLAGMSGVELAYEVIYRLYDREEVTPPVFRMQRTPEYWAGWVLAYYQWKSGYTFKEIIERVPIDTIIRMYHPYHEIDISQFADAMDELMERALDNAPDPVEPDVQNSRE